MAGGWAEWVLLAVAVTGLVGGALAVGWSSSPGRLVVPALAAAAVAALAGWRLGAF